MGRGVTLWCGLLLAIGLSGEMALATPNLPPDPPSVAQNLQANPNAWPVLESNSFRARFPEGYRHSVTNYQGINSDTWEGESGDPLHMFTLTVTNLPPGSIGAANLDEYLFSIIEQRASALRGEVTQKKRLEHPSAPGCLFKIITSDAEWDFMVRVRDSSVYLLSVCSMPGEGEDGYKETFFDAFSCY